MVGRGSGEPALGRGLAAFPKRCGRRPVTLVQVITPHRCSSRLNRRKTVADSTHLVHSEGEAAVAPLAQQRYRAPSLAPGVAGSSPAGGSAASPTYEQLRAAAVTSTSLALRCSLVAGGRIVPLDQPLVVVGDLAERQGDLFERYRQRLGKLGNLISREARRTFRADQDFLRRALPQRHHYRRRQRGRLPGCPAARKHH